MLLRVLPLLEFSRHDSPERLAETAKDRDFVAPCGITTTRQKKQEGRRKQNEIETSG